MALCTGPVAVAQTTTMDYSYYDGTTDLAQTGSGKKETYDVAIHINQPALTGTTIKGVIISIPHTTAVSDLKVWLSKELTLQSIDGKKQNVPDISTQPADTALAFSSTYIPLDHHRGWRICGLHLHHQCRWNRPKCGQPADCVRKPERGRIYDTFYQEVPQMG